MRNIEPDAWDPIGPPRADDAGDAAPAAPSLAPLLEKAVALDASDIHIAPDYPPMLRVNGELTPASADPVLRAATRSMAEAVAPPRLRGRIDALKNFDCSIRFEHAGGPRRFRANVYLSQGDWCLSLRHVPVLIPTLDQLGFPLTLAERIVANRNGLVVVSGVTGSGKTSSLAAIVALLRRDPTRRVITIEEPIEFVHAPAGGGMVTQREVGRDVDSFSDGLKYGLRQDPDVIFVGEVRDRETAQMALSAAETGHLVLTTLHTRDAKGCLTRLVDLFPEDQQSDVRSQLALSLRSVVCQRLLPAAHGEGRALVMEVLHSTPPVQVAIRSGRIETIDSIMQTGRRDGHVLLDDDLQRAVSAGRVSLESARLHATEPERLTATRGAW